MSIVPIQIRPHLVSYFFKESDGKEHAYANKRVKTVIYTSDISGIGRIIRRLMEKADRHLNVDHFNLCLTISDLNNKKSYKGEIYKFANGANSYLRLPQEANDDINDLLEDLFRMSFISYMNGCIENNSQAVVLKAIDKFIAKYDLEEFGFCNDSLRQLYYREKKNAKILARFQSKSSNNILKFNQ
ncbi:hypothetical protein AAGV28_07020 [Flavobacterium sp. FZUC8N2.13]|uniref:Uncharacterized protein n=1 Tax=Flavobacterium zubiriense TaxID=3138075 RepID=A0ABV4TDI8_9FLAO